MSTNNFVKSDLMILHDMVQSSMITYPKEIIIATLRDLFAKDYYYHYAKDPWGFPNTTDHTDLAPSADLPTQIGEDGVDEEGLSTRIFIGENYRFDGILYPAILVKNGGSKYVPISINRDQESVQYEDIIYEDGYGNQTVVRRPKTFITAGAWEGSIIIDILSRSLRARDEIVEIIAMCFTEFRFDSLVDIGIIAKPLDISSPSESDDRNNKLFRQTITIPIRTEWRREIPVGNLIESIVFSTSFVNLENPDIPASPNLTINTEINLLDLLVNQSDGY